MVLYSIQYSICLQCDDDKKAFNVSRRPELVDWSAFISQLGLEEKLKQQTE